MPIDCLDVIIHAGSVVEVESGEVKLPDIASVVHVTEEDVHILGGAESWNTKLKASTMEAKVTLYTYK